MFDELFKEIGIDPDDIKRWQKEQQEAEEKMLATLKEYEQRTGKPAIEFREEE